MPKLENKQTLLRLLIIIALAVLAIVIYIFAGVGANPAFIIPRRTNQVIAISLVAVAVAYSSIMFQTLTNNRILTPAVIGFESIYMFIQTLIVLVFSYGSYLVTGIGNFALSIGIMLIFAFVIYAIMFRKGGHNPLFLVLTGMVIGAMFSSLTTYLQMLIDPSEFFIIQNRMFASFDAINLDLLYVSGIIIIAAVLLSLPYIKYLDVLLLGREHAIGLGVNYSRISKYFMALIAIFVSVSTALVGPVTFLGVLVANLTYQYIKNFRHIYILPACVAITLVALVFGQYLVSRVFQFSTTLSIIINFAGGLYFLLLLLKQNKKAKG